MTSFLNSSAIISSRPRVQGEGRRQANQIDSRAIARARSCEMGLIQYQGTDQAVVRQTTEPAADPPSRLGYQRSPDTGLKINSPGEVFK